MFFRDFLLKAQIPYSSKQLFNWGLGTSGQLGYGILPASFTQVVGGPSHAAGITSNGALMLWGLGTNGQLGDTFALTRSTPVQVPGIWLSVGLGDLHTVAVRGDNTLFAWGNNATGQLGDGTTLNKSSPVQIGTSSNWASASASTSNTYAITLPGTLYAWGVNTGGQIGDGTTLNKSSPVAIGTSSWSIVRAGTSFANAIRSDGLLFAWGLNSTYQLGNSEIMNRSSPVQIGLNNSWKQLSAGQSHSVAIRNDGTLWVWGTATAIGLQGNQAYSWTKIASGSGSHSAGIRSDGSLWTWGLGASGQIGDGQTLTRSSPTLVGVSSWIDVSVGPSTTAAVDSTGKLYGWGLNTSGQAGDNTVINRSSPVQIGVGTSFVNVALGNLHGVALDQAYRLYAWGQAASLNLGGNIFPEATLASKAYNNGNNGALIKTNGTLFVWGFNDNGTIGDGTTVSKSSPVQIAGSWNSLSVGAGHILGIKSDSTLWAWGANTNGQLGLGDTANRNSPVQIGSAANWSVISAGTNFSFAINTAGQLYAWGINSQGQLGDGSIVDKSSPVNYGSTSWSAVSAGASHSLAISSNGNLYAWGSGLLGATGQNNTATISNPAQITSVTRSWTIVAAGFFQSHALTTLGEKFSWGGNGGGQLGLNDATAKSNPTQVPGSTSWTQIAANFNTSYAIDTLGKLYSTGVNNIGSLGLNYASVTVQLSNYTQITPGTSYTFITAGDTGINAAAVSSDARYYAWGDNSRGQIGNSDTLTKIAPFTLLGPATPSFSSPTVVGSDYFSKVTAGVSYSIGLKTDYTLWSWGLNGGGQLGVGDIITRSSPTQIGSYFNIGPLSYTTVSAGASHALAISSTNKLFVWGINTSTSIVNQVFSWTQLVVGQLHGAGIRNDGLLFTWGTNAQGQLGNNSTSASNSPILVSNSSWTTVAAGASNTSAIRSDGTLWAWGDNTYGQLGQGDTGISRSSITQIGSANTWTKIANGNYYLMAINGSGSLYGVGANPAGQLGLGDINNRSNITIVPGATVWSQVTAGGSHTLALDSGNNLWAFGLGTSGQLGYGTAANRSTPTQITGSTWSKVAAGSSHVIAIRSDTTLWAWGAGTLGQVGQGTTAVSRSSPVLVAAATGLGGASSYTQVAAGLDFSLATKSDGTLWGFGQNNVGQLGVGDSVNRSGPVQVSLAVQVSSLGTFGSGLNQWAGVIGTNNTVYNWGFNTSGQIADSTSVTKSSPIQLGSTGLMGSMSWPVQIGTSSWTAVAAGSSFSLAVRSDYTLWGWGLNTSNQLGNNDAITRSSPVQVSGAGTSSYTQVAATAATGFGIQTSNLLWGWGLGTSGQVGDITILTKAIPTNVGNLNTGIVAATGSPYQVGSGSSYTQVGAGLSFTTAMKDDGTIWTWGLGSSGQLGQNNAVTYSSPVQVGSLSSYFQIAVGGATQYFILGNKLLYATGLGTSGQLADTSLVSKSAPVLVINTVIASSSSPVQVGIGTSSWTAVSAGSTHTAAIRSDGLLFEWGSNANYAISAGTPPDSVNRSSPVQIGTSSWTAVAAGKSNFTLAIRSDNSLWGWGLNAGYQLGVGDSGDRSSPVLISAAAWNRVSGGLYASGGIDNTQKLYMWGTNNSGIFGDNQTVSTIRSLPIQLGTSEQWSEISVGLSHALAIRNTGQLYAWGLNTNYRLGDGTSITKSSPVLIGSPYSWILVSAGADHSVALRSDLTLWTWGNGATGALGIVSQPYSWTQLNVNASSAVGLRTDGTIWTWGLNTNGQLGQNNTITTSSPVQVGTGNSWTFVFGGNQFMGAIRNDGAMFTWGINTSFQLGDGTAVSKSSPVQVLGTTSFIQAAAGSAHTLAIGANNVGLYTWGLIADTLASNGDLSYSQISEGAGGHTAAIRSDGYLFVWGNNSVGQLGTNNTATYSSPTQIGINQYSLVSAGLSHTLAIDTMGRLWAWGLNSTYQLGNSDNITRSSPVQVGADSSWIGIAAGFSHSIAIRSDGALFAWGLGTSGQQGQLTETKSWSSLSAGATHAAGVAANKLYVWGLGTSGQLGTSDAITRSSPTLTSTTDTNSWKLVGAGATHTLFTQYDNGAWAAGNNIVGQLGDTTTVNRTSPVLVGAGLAILDSSNTPHTITNNNGTRYTTTTIPLTGSVSGYFPGTATDILTSVSTDYAIGASTDFTIECWINVTNWNNPAGGRYDAILEAQDGTNIWTLGVSNPGFTAVWIFASNIEGGWGGYRGTASSSYNWGTSGWHHFAVVRQSGVYRCYIDGVGGTTATYTNLALTTGSTTLKVGPYLNGYISNLRFVKGTAVYTGNFTPPSLAVLAVSGATSAAAYPSTTNVNTTFAATSTILLTYTTPGASISGGPILYTQVAAGLSHSAGINAAGGLFTWGLNSTYQIGNGDSVNRSSPVQINSGTSSYTQVSLGASNSAAIDSAGSLWVWGSGVGGQLAQVTDSTVRSIPVQLPAGGTWSKVSMGYSHTLAIKSDGSLWAWGFNNSGQLGTWTSSLAGITTSSPTQVSSPGTSWSLISAGVGHSLGIQADGTLWGWGANDVGQVGYIPVTNNINSWTQVKMNINTIAGVTHVAALKSDNTLWTWGNNAVGQLGLGDTANRSSPVQVGGLSNYSQISLGASHTLAIKSDGSLWAWGSNTNWQLGLGVGSSNNRSSPVLVAEGTSWSAISAGGQHSSAIDTSGTLYYWGNTVTLMSAPWSWTTISAGGSHTVAVRSDGKLFTWGINSRGQLGDGTTANRSSPNQIGNSSWTTASAGGGFTLAIKPDGTLWSWGYGGFGQLGLGPTEGTIDKSSPTQVGSLTTWSKVSGGGTHSLATDSSGILYAWGQNIAGQLGLTDANPSGDTINRSSPVAVSSSSYSIISAGGSHTMAITSGKLFAWGANPFGQLGLTNLSPAGDIINRSSPVQIGASSWAAVAAGASHTVGVLSVGTLFAWGNGTNGEIGNGTAANRSSPVSIGAGTWSPAVVAGLGFSGAINNIGVVYTWGTATNGEMGISAANNRSSPTIIPGTNSFTLISTGNGGDHMGGITTTGALFTWGNSNVGQTGVGDTQNRSVIIQVGLSTNPGAATNQFVPAKIGTSSWTKVAAGLSYQMALRAVDGALFTWGLGSSGQLGLNNVLTYSSPTQVGVISYSQIHAATSFSYGINALTSALYTWGADDQFQCARFDGVGRSVPTLANTTVSFGQISSGTSWGIGIATSNTNVTSYGIYTWGTSTESGQGFNVSIPTQLGTTTSWTTIGGSAAINNSLLYIWGTSASGQQGEGSTYTRSSPVILGYKVNIVSPVQIAVGSWVQAEAGKGSAFSLARDSNGTLYGWGQDSTGQIGI